MHDVAGISVAISSKSKLSFSERFDVLDSWRGICAIFVAIFHFSFVMQEGLLQSAFLANAYLFVDFFFVLSGFVICHAYGERLARWRDIGAFVVRRVGRVWPLHVALLALFALAIGLINLSGVHPRSLDMRLAEGGYSLLAFTLNALLLNSMSLYGNAWNSPAWSIGAELYTYILFAAVVPLAGRRLPRAALALAVGAMLVLLAVAPSYMNSTADYGFVRCVAGFFTGVALYRLHRATRAAPLPMPTVVELGVVMFAGLFIIAAGNGPDEVFALSVAAPLVFGLAILVFAREAGALSRALTAAPLRALGRWSYSIYMVHMPLLVLLGYGVWLYGRLTGTQVEQVAVVNGHIKHLYALEGAATPMLLASYLTAVVATAALTYRAIEAPWRDRFNSLAQKLQRARAATSSGRQLASGRSAAG